MKVNVRFQGALGLDLAGTDPRKPIIVELPPKATLQELFKRLNIVEPQKIIVTMDYRILKNEDPLPEGADLRMFQLVSGG